METHFGPKRNDDVVLRIQSNFIKNQSFIPLQARQWKVVQLSAPEPPPPNTKVSLPNVRACQQLHIQGPVFQFLSLLGYSYSFDVIKQGYQVELIDGIRMRIYQLFQASSFLHLSELKKPLFSNNN